MFNLENRKIDNPDWLVIKDCNKIDTFDSEGISNGYLIDILNTNDSIMSQRKDEKFSQFYMASVYKNKFKGLHVHPYKKDAIHCIHGRICVVFYPKIIGRDSDFNKINFDDFLFIELGKDNNKTISFPSKYPHGFFGIDELSLIINYRTPAWTIEDNHQYDIVDNKLVKFLKGKYSLK